MYHLAGLLEVAEFRSDGNISISAWRSALVSPLESSGAGRWDHDWFEARLNAIGGAFAVKDAPGGPIDLVRIESIRWRYLL